MRADKGLWATGEGDFTLSLAAARAAVITSMDGVADLDELVAAARVEADPVAALAKLLGRRHPEASVATTPPEQP